MQLICINNDIYTLLVNTVSVCISMQAWVHISSLENMKRHVFLQDEYVSEISYTYILSTPLSENVKNWMNTAIVEIEK